jgi:type I restriction enzyme M protein
VQTFTTARTEALAEIATHQDWMKTVAPAAIAPVADENAPLDAATAGQLATNEQQLAWAEQFGAVVPALKGLQKQLNEVRKLTLRAVDVAAKQLSARKSEAWNSRETREWQTALEAAHEASLHGIKETLYAFQQVRWLHEKFPEAALVDVLGLCRLVTRSDIAEQDHSLTPGRYVGVAPPSFEDDGSAFEDRMRAIHSELAELNEAAVELATQIAKNFEDLAL